MKIFDMFGEIFIDDKKANKKLDGLKTGLSNIGGGIKKAGKFIAVGVGAAAVGLGVTVTKVAETTDNIDKMSQKIGFSRQAFQEWDFILSQSGADVNGLQTGMKTLSNAIFEAGEGTDTYTDALGALGLEYEDLNGLSQEEQFDKVFKALANTEDATTRTAIASQLLGKSATELAPALNAGGDAIEDMRVQANDLGLILSDDAVDAGVVFTDTMDQVKRTLGAAVTEGIAPLLPKITEMANLFIEKLPLIMEKIQGMKDRVVEIKDAIAGWFNDNAPKIDAIKEKFSEFFGKVQELIAPFIESIKESTGESGFLTAGLDLLFDAIDFVADALNIAIDVIKEIIDWMKEHEALTKALAIVFLSIAAAVLAYNVIMGIASGVTAAFGVVIGIATSPITLIILAILAVIAITVLLVKNWDKVKAWFGRLWEGIKDMFAKAWDFIKDLFFNFHPLGIIIKNWDEIVDFFKGIGDKIKETFTNMIDAAKDWGKDLMDGFVQGIKDKIQKFKDTFSNVANIVKDFLGFSVPEKGPLSNFDKSGGDMMDLFADSAKNRMPALTQSLRGIAGDINASIRPGGQPSSGGASIVINFNNPITDRGIADWMGNKIVRELKAKGVTI
jgi:hypothetical protein